MSKISFLLRHTALATTIIGLATGYARAGSGIITYQMDFVSQFSSTGTGNGQLSGPEQITVGSDNNLYIADRDNNRVQVFDKSGNYVSQFGSSGYGNGQFSNTIGITPGSDGSIIVAELQGQLRVQFFDASTYAYTGQFGSVGTGNGQFSNDISFITTDSTGRIYVSDYGGGRVEIFDHNGNYLNQFANSIGTFGIAIDSSNKIYVSNELNSTVSIYDSSYNFLGYLATNGSGVGQVSNPDGVSVDSQDNVYVVDRSNNRVEIFDKNGTLLLTYDNGGTSAGQFNVPRSVYADDDGKIYVGELGINAIDILQLTSTETFNGSPAGGNETAAAPLSNLVLNGSGIFADSFIGYHQVDLNGANWTLSGTNNFTGNVELNAGTLTNNGTLGGDQLDIAYGTTLYNNSNISVGSILNVNGTLQNDGTITGGVANSGTLIDIGNITSIFYNFGFASGTGTVGTLTNFGTLQPGLGTLTINNNYNDNGSSFYNVAVNAAGQSSKIIIGNAATLGGGTVAVNADTSVYHVNNSYVILTAAGGISGTFATVTSNLAFLTPALDYSNPNQVTLTLTRNDGVDPFQTAVDFVPYAASGNQQAAAVALSSYSASAFNGDTATYNAVQSLSVADAGKLLNEVSPDQVAAMPAVQTAMITSMQTPMFQRLQSAPVSSSSTQGFGFVTPNSPPGISPDQVWLQTIGGVSNQDNSSNGAAGYRLGTVGVRGGADKDINDKTKLGLSFAYAHGTANYKGSNDSSQTQYAHADLYGRHELNTKKNIILEGFLGAGGGRLDSTRYITAGTLNNTIIGNTNAYDVSGAVKLNNPIRITPSDIITPNITTAASWTRQNGYTETGSPFALQMNSITSTPVTVTPMVNWQHTIKDEKHGFNLTPDLGIGATWQLSELNNNVNANFANSTTAPSFTTQSAKQDPLSLNLSAAVTMQPFTSNKYVPQLTAQATMQSSSTTTNTTGTLTAKWDW